MPVALPAKNAGELYHVLVLEGDSFVIHDLVGPGHPRLLICFVRGQMLPGEIEKFVSRTSDMGVAPEKEHVFEQSRNVSISTIGFTLYGSHDWRADSRFRLLRRLWDAHGVPHNQMKSCDQYTFYLEYHNVCRESARFLSGQAGASADADTNAGLDDAKEEPSEEEPSKHRGLALSRSQSS